jgi:hypothetical protein
VAHGEAGIDDVFDEEDITALDADGEVVDDLDLARALRARVVGGDLEGIEDRRQFEVADQVAEEDELTLEDADDDERLTGVVAADFGAEFGDAGGDLLGREHHAGLGIKEEGVERDRHGVPIEVAGQTKALFMSSPKPPPPGTM